METEAIAPAGYKLSIGIVCIKKSNTGMGIEGAGKGKILEVKFDNLYRVSEGGADDGGHGTGCKDLTLGPVVVSIRHY